MKKHERKIWNCVAAVRGKRSHKANRKLLKQWCAKTQEVDGVKVKMRKHAPKSKGMKHYNWWI